MNDPKNETNQINVTETNDLSTLAPPPIEFYDHNGDRKEYADVFSLDGDWMGRTSYDDYMKSQQSSQYIF